jgi:hypothetical protein
VNKAVKHQWGALALLGGFLVFGGRGALAYDGVGSRLQMGDVSPTVAAAACGNAAAAIDARGRARCAGGRTGSSTGSSRTRAERGSDGSLPSHVHSAFQAGEASPSVGVTVCGNAFGALDARAQASCAGRQRGRSGDGSATEPASVGGDERRAARAEDPGTGPRVSGAPHDKVLGERIRGLPDEVLGDGLLADPAATTLTARPRTATLPFTGSLIRTHAGWALLFLVSGAGLCLRDALMR